MKLVLSFFFLFLIFLASSGAVAPVQEGAQDTPSQDDSTQQGAGQLEIVRHETVEDVVGWVVTDLLTIPDSERPFIRYIWVPSWQDSEEHYAVIKAVNAVCSSSGVIQKPVLIANNHLQRWDLRLLAPEDKELIHLIKQWDHLNTLDPYFHDLALFSPGKTEAVPKTDEDDPDTPPQVVQVLPPLAPSINLKLEELLNAFPLRFCPVYRSDWFITIVTSAISPGRYQEFRRFDQATVIADSDIETGTPEQKLLARFGVFETAAKKVDGDRRVGIFHSGVTGKPRSIIVVNGFKGYCWITEDIFDEDVGTSRHPIYNLLDNDYRGREIIFELDNGLHAYLLTDNQGNILREAPPNLVSDHQVPAPYTRRLDAGAISCIRCHAVEGGLRDASNDVARILSSPTSSALTLLEDRATIDDIVTRYSGRRFNRSILLGRDTYAAANETITNGQLTSEQLDQLIGSIFNRYQYTLVNAATVVEDLGFSLTPSSEERREIEARALLMTLINTPIPPEVSNFILLEDPTIAALTVGIPVRRFDYERIHTQLLLRSLQYRKEKESDQ